MPQDLPNLIAKKFAEYERRIASLERTPRLTNSSIDDGSINVKDEDGLIKTIIGKQPDGSHGVLPRNSGPQPTPSAPILPAGTTDDPVRSSFPVEWDGQADGPVPEVYGHLEVWGQRLVGDDLEDVSLAKLMGTIRDRDGGATTVAAGSPGVWVFWFRMAGPDRVTKGEFSFSSTVTVTALVDAGDIEARLNAFADGELGDGAYENLLVRLGEFMNIRADQIDVNSLAADSAFIALLETAGIILRDEAAGRRTEVSGQGLSITDTVTEQPIMQLGLYGDDFFSLTNLSGEQSVVLNRNGLIAGEVVSADEDMMVGGKPLIGSGTWGFPGVSSNDAVLDHLPRGILAQQHRPFQDQTTTASEVAIAHLNVRMMRGRVYRIFCPPFAMGSSTTGAEMVVYQTTGAGDWPAMPSSASFSRGPQGGRLNYDGEPVLSYDVTYRPAQDEYFRCIFVVRRRAGTSMTFLPWTRGIAQPMILDAGADNNHTGREMFRPASDTSDVGVSESIQVTATPSSSRFYESSNVASTSWGTSIAETTRLRHGFWDASFMTQPTHYVAIYRFGSQAAAINGREVLSAYWRVFVDDWALKTIGDSIYPGVRALTSELPSNVNPYASSYTWLPDIEGLIPGRWATVPVPDEHIQDAINGNANLMLGRPTMSRRAGAATPKTGGVELVFRVSQE